MELLGRIFNKRPKKVKLTASEGLVFWGDAPLQLTDLEHDFLIKLMHEKICSAKEFGPSLGTSGSWKNQLRMLNYNLFYQTTGQCQVLMRPNPKDKRGICFELNTVPKQDHWFLFNIFSF
jgi:hypothetical protein